MLTESQFNSTLRWEDFVRNLILNAGCTTSVPKAGTGPILPMYAIRFDNLEAPRVLRELMSEISSSGNVVDHSADSAHINDDTHRCDAADPCECADVPAAFFLSQQAKQAQLFVNVERSRCAVRALCACEQGALQWTWRGHGYDGLRRVHGRNQRHVQWRQPRAHRVRLRLQPAVFLAGPLRSVGARDAAERPWPPVAEAGGRPICEPLVLDHRHHGDGSDCPTLARFTCLWNRRE